MVEIYWERTLNFILFWGIWLLVPLMVDVLTAIVYFASLAQDRWKAQEEEPTLKYYPYVTVVVPVHNSSATLEKCLTSLVEQRYPAGCIQVVCVNNGSKDDSFEVFQRFQYKYQDLSLMWTSLDQSGKSIALNAGLYAGQGSYLINLDADTWLDSEAILEVVRAFEKDQYLVAATGTIRVDKVLGEGFRLLDLINYCEVVEYLIAFDVGRRYQTKKNTLFTLSGAFSAFRRDIILQSFMYQTRTVSEDTDLTYNIRETLKTREGRLACLPQAIAYVEPIESLYRLYSQRVRWQRGEIEVVSTVYDKVPGAWQALHDFTSRLLVADHTLAFSRLAWTFLIPFLYFLGYSLPMVLTAMGGLFVCYLIIDALYFFVGYKSVSQSYRQELKKIWWVIFLLPFFRYIAYWFRLAGIIISVTEQKTWQVENPLKQVEEVYNSYKERADKLTSFAKWWRKK